MPVACRYCAPHKDEKMAAIHKALDECSAEYSVFYEDEVILPT